MVSHDRYFMDRMVEHLFVFEGDGAIRDFPGNYGLYQQWLKTKDDEETTESKTIPAITVKEPVVAVKLKPKISYKKKRSWKFLKKKSAI